MSDPSPPSAPAPAARPPAAGIASSSTTMPALVARVDGRTEQAWNQSVLAQPVGTPVARFWTYPAPAIVRGRAQRGGRGLIGAVPGLADPLPLIDRDAGGGAVLIGPWMLSLSVALPVDDPRVAGAVADGTRWLGEAFVTALARHRIRAEALPRERTVAAPAHLAWACFAGLSPWEVVVGPRKLVGFAQRRTRQGVLLVGGLLLGPVPWSAMTRTLGRPSGDADELAASSIDGAELTGAALPADDFAATLAGDLPGLLPADTPPAMPV